MAQGKKNVAKPVKGMFAIGAVTVNDDMRLRSTHPR